MKIEIISVIKKEFEEVTTNEPLPFYRRHSPDHWEHFLGDLHGWAKYTFTELLEETYQKWMRKESNE